MNCPKCGGYTHVVDTRPTCEDVHRRRECLSCGHRFNTVELEEELQKKKTPQLRRFLVEYDPVGDKFRIRREASR